MESRHNGRTAIKHTELMHFTGTEHIPFSQSKAVLQQTTSLQVFQSFSPLPVFLYKALCSALVSLGLHPV